MRSPEKCPHDGQVEFSPTGVACCECGKNLVWVRAPQLAAIRARLESAPRSPADVVLEILPNGLHRLVQYGAPDGRRALVGFFQGSRSQVLEYAEREDLEIEETLHLSEDGTSVLDGGE